MRRNIRGSPEVIWNIFDFMYKGVIIGLLLLGLWRIPTDKAIGFFLLMALWAYYFIAVRVEKGGMKTVIPFTSKQTVLIIVAFAAGMIVRTLI